MRIISEQRKLLLIKELRAIGKCRGMHRSLTGCRMEGVSVKGALTLPI